MIYAIQIKSVGSDISILLYLCVFLLVMICLGRITLYVTVKADEDNYDFKWLSTLNILRIGICIIRLQVLRQKQKQNKTAETDHQKLMISQDEP